MAEHEVMETDVLFVGGGPANLAGAIHLMNLLEKHNAAHPDKKLEPLVALIEKAAEVGMHGVSGLVLDPRAIKVLLPEHLEQGFPIEGKVTYDAVMYFTENDAFKLPITPPPFQNHGNYICSLAKITQWMARLAESKGVNLFSGFAGKEVLFDGSRVIGVRTGDKGIDKEGTKRPNFEAGIDLTAGCTVFGEGPRGTLMLQLRDKLNLFNDINPQTYSTGVKEIIEMPKGSVPGGRVFHTMGFPLDTKTYGGGFIYDLADDKIAIGYVVGLDYQDPSLNPHTELQKLKNHKWVRDYLKGGKVVEYGAKTIPSGGFFSMPELVFDGGLIVGDSAGFLNMQRLKGVHLAMESGMMAAEAIFDALKNKADTGPWATAASLHPYKNSFNASSTRQELWAVRNFHQGFHGGLFAGVFHAALQQISGGRGLVARMGSDEDFKRLSKLSEVSDPRPDPDLKMDGAYLVDKLTDVYLSGTTHEENQPPHLLVPDRELCATRCAEEFGNPCQYFCPAVVYEMEENAQTKRRELKLNPSNCVHCKTCDIKDPYKNIKWVPPEGGGGPKHRLM